MNWLSSAFARAVRILGLSLLASSFSSLATADDYDIRHFDSLTHLYGVDGPDLSSLLTPGKSFFMGAHFRQTKRNPVKASGTVEPHPIVTVADSKLAGAHRYMRLEVYGTGSSSPVDFGVNFVAKTEGVNSGGQSIRGLSVGSTVPLNQWFAAGVLVEVFADRWEFTVFKQKHGAGEALETKGQTGEYLNYTEPGERVDLYSVARHKFVKTPPTLNSAHQFFGDIASPVFVLNPTRAEVESFMSQEDPTSIWTASDFASRPDMDTLADPGGADWSLRDVDGLSSLNGVLSLAGGAGGGGDPSPERPAAPTLLDVGMGE